MSIDPRRRAELLTAKLAALVRATGDETQPGPGFPAGAAAHTQTATWVLLTDDADADNDPTRALGGVMAWFRRDGHGTLQVVVSDAAVAGVLARRAALFDPAPTVWLVAGDVLTHAVPASPAPPGDVPAPEAELFVPLLREAGLEVVVEGGIVRGEVLGLEVARVAADDSNDLAAPLKLRVGVGRFDQEASELVHRDQPDAAVLAAAVSLVSQHRRPGAAPHPLNQLVPERWLRSVLRARPDLVGARALEMVAPVPPRRNLRERSVAPLLGQDDDGAPLLVVASHGVDLDAVPAAADARATHAPDATLVLAVPARDVLPVTEALAAALTKPARVVAIPDDWSSLVQEPG